MTGHHDRWVPRCAARSPSGSRPGSGSPAKSDLLTRSVSVLVCMSSRTYAIMFASMPRPAESPIGLAWRSSRSRTLGWLRCSSRWWPARVGSSAVDGGPRATVPVSIIVLHMRYLRAMVGHLEAYFGGESIQGYREAWDAQGLRTPRDENQSVALV